MRLLREAACLSISLGCALSLAGVAGAEKLSGTGRAVSRHGVPAAGGTASGNGLALTHSIGDTAPFTQQGGARRLPGGLGQLLAQPGTVTSIVAVTKATGALELAWTAPGLDGFQGSVTAGFYRLDFSSDGAHVFAPDIYQLEFSTTVSPGAPQSVTLTGLLPNTTYYTRVYLGSNDRRFADDSAKSDEPTLANAPVPTVTQVGISSITLTWLLPQGGAAGYENRGSSTNFGALFPGGIVVASSTPNGTLLSLTLENLAARTTYFLRVAAVNWKGEPNFSATLQVRTETHRPEIMGLVLSSAPLTRTVGLAWTNPGFSDLSGVLVVLSTNAAPPALPGGTSLVPGTVLSDASIVRSSAPATSYTETGLQLDTTFFYHLFSQFAQFTGTAYSTTPVSASVFLDLPPRAPGLAGKLSADRQRFFLSWSPVTMNSDDSVFKSTQTPQPFELARYELQRATAPLASWVRIATAAASVTALAEDLPPGGGTLLYRVAAVDSLGTSGESNAVSSQENILVFTPDGSATLETSPTAALDLSSTTNGLGVDLLLRVAQLPAVEKDVLTAARFEAVELLTGKRRPDFRFVHGSADVSLAYAVRGGAVVPSAVPAAVAEIPANDAERRLGLYWNDGAKFIKLYGRVDPAKKTLALANAPLGEYQVRALVRDGGFSFDVTGLSNRAITPNGDGLNDTAIFVFDNPRDSGVTGTIFDLNGARVADMGRGPIANSLQWDARAYGRVVSGGAYLYQIKAENRTFRGTLFVVR